MFSGRNLKFRNPGWQQYIAANVSNVLRNSLSLDLFHKADSDILLARHEIFEIDIKI